MPPDAADRAGERPGSKNPLATASIPTTVSDPATSGGSSARPVRQPVRITSQDAEGKRTTTTVTTVRADASAPVRVRAEGAPAARRGLRADKHSRATNGVAAANGAGAGPAVAPAAVPAPTKRRGGRPRVRRVTRVIRRVDAWSVFKVSFVFFVAAYAVMLVAGALLWQVGVSTGAIDNVENFIRDLFVEDTFTIDGEKILRASWILGGIFVVAATAATTTLAVLFNLISDLVGGIKVLVLEEEVVRRSAAPADTGVAAPATPVPPTSSAGPVPGEAITG